LFIKNNYRLDIIIWQLNLSCSVFESRELIKRGLVFVNQKPTKIFNLFLKKGDIITLRNDIQNKIYKQKKDIILTFLEIDFYLNTFIITKDLDELSSQDITCLMQEKYSSYLLKNIIN
jgi:ribosomal protein S4